ncbi:MAG TPA: hypothetical protein GX717_05025 [Clostridiaceae bacterium]|nr:hypothetical protein [Clostridiaceae bacterium]
MLNHFSSRDTLVLQNEINHLPLLIRAAKKRGMRVVFNPSPFDQTILSYPLSQVDVLFVNEIEGNQLLSGATKEERKYSPVQTVQKLTKIYGIPHIIMTLGETGSVVLHDGVIAAEPAIHTNAVDTTGAGDTFTGYYLAGLESFEDHSFTHRLASLAASLTVSRKGAATSIPYLHEVMSHMNLN